MEGGAKPALVSIEGDTVRLSVTGVPEARLAIKQLRLEKKQLALQKRQNAAELAELKRGHRTETAGKGPVMRGGGGFGQIVRSFQSMDRSSTRNRQLQEVSPYEIRKAELDAMAHAIDSAILRLEMYIHEHSQ